MTLLDLLDRLSARDVQIWADGDRLRLRAAVGVITPELRHALETHKPELLARLRAEDGGGDAARMPIVRLPRSARLPLSFAQQRLWFLAQLEPDSAAYNIPAAIRIGGRLDAVVLERAANEIIRRHEVLRTTFGNEGGEAVLAMASALSIELSVIDLGQVARHALRDEIRARAADQTRALFDLTRGPLLRVALLRIAPDDHVLLFTIHHLASDGWSSRVFMSEVAVLYDAFVNGRQSPLPELPIQYADFAAWQRQWLQGDVLERQLSYWRNRLDRLPTLPLPTDRPRPPRQTFDGASLQFTLPLPLASALKALARQEGVTLFQLLLAGFAALLSQVTGSEDIPIGSPVANRSRRELESLIGFFVNPVLLRVDLTGRPTFRDLLVRVRALTLDAYAHQDLPFEQLVAEVQPERDLSRHALFQVVFVLQDNPVERQEIQGLVLRQLDTESWHVKFDLVVNMWDSQDGLVAWWEYNTALFERDTIATLFERYVRLLSGAAERPEVPVADVEILSPDELAWLTSELTLPGFDHEFALPALTGA